MGTFNSSDIPVLNSISATSAGVTANFNTMVGANAYLIYGSIHLSDLAGWAAAGGTTAPPGSYSVVLSSPGLFPLALSQSALYYVGVQAFAADGSYTGLSNTMSILVPPVLQDGHILLTDNNGNTVEVPVPEYGYKAVISLPFDIDTLDTGIKTVYAYDDTLDKYHCECDLILNETDMLAFNSWIKDAALGRAKNNCTMQMNANSGFFPFTPLHGDAGIFTVGILVSKSEKIQDNPFRYFKISISIFKQSTFPAYSLQSQINEGSLSIGTVNNIRFPESYFDSDEDNSIQSNVDESGTLNFIDRSRIASSWRTSMKLSAGTGKTAAILDYLINTARAGNFALTTQAYHYAFGRDKGSSSAYTVSLIQDSIEVTHELFNKFVFDLNVQYIAG
jgi:hypothetical protein